MILRFLLLLFTLSAGNAGLQGQTNDLGGWYMYFGNFRFQNSQVGAHGEVQYRNHNLIGDMQQLLLRTSVQYHLKASKSTFSLGYGHIISQSEGEPNNTFSESRIYQEAVLRQSVGRFRILHRYRFEQRFIEDRDFRTRFRYALFVNIPINKSSMEKGAVYLALYDEIFLNGGVKATGRIFDRNRAYAALGYKIGKDLAIQAGFMQRGIPDNNKGQLQLSVIQNFNL